MMNDYQLHDENSALEDARQTLFVPTYSAA